MRVSVARPVLPSLFGLLLPGFVGRVDAQPPTCPVCGPDAVGAGATGDIKFQRGHFTCLSCDASTCAGCDKILCEVSQCVGQFGGETKKGCDPWWWCDGDHPPGDHVGESLGLLQQRQKLRGVQRHDERQQLPSPAATSSAAMLQVSAGSNRTQDDKAKGLAFKPARFICTSGAMAPKVQNAETGQNEEVPVLVFEKSSCKGASMDTTCFCYNNYAYLGGEDPQTSELKCDPSCKEGPCDGRTCGSSPPPPLGGPPPFAAGKNMPPVRTSEEEMIPMSEAMSDSVTAPPT